MPIVKKKKKFSGDKCSLAIFVSVYTFLTITCYSVALNDGSGNLTAMQTNSLQPNVSHYFIYFYFAFNVIVICSC